VSDDTGDGGDRLHRPRTVDTGARSASAVLLRPRTIGALGRPDPMPPIMPPIATVEALTSPTYEPATGSTPAVLDPDLWIVDEAIDEIDRTGPVPATAAMEPGMVVDEVAEAASPGGLLRSNLLVASGTLVSRITGLIRTTLIAGLFVQSLADTYLLANNTPNIIYELILGGILTATLVPLFTDDLENGDGESTNAVISFTVVVLVLLTLLTAVLSPLLMTLYSLGSGSHVRGDFRTAGIRLAVLFSPQVFFYGLMALWSAVLNARHRFFAAAWAPVLNNLLVIGVFVATWRAAGHAPRISDLLNHPEWMLLLGLGTSLGIAAMALSLYPALRRSGMRMHFKFQPRHPAVRRVVRLSAWTLGYVISNQIALIIVSILAEPGSGGVRDYQVAYQFFQLPHGLLAVSIMVTMEPLLGRAEARGDRRTFNRQLLLGFRLIAMLVIPAAVGYLALPAGISHGIQPASDAILGRVLHYGGIVGAFAVGLPGFSTYLYAFRGFYAMKDTRTPFIINCFENLLNIALAIVFHRWWGVVGLALSFSVAYTVSAGVAVVVLARRSPGFDLRGLLWSLTKLLLAGVVMGGFVFGFAAVIAPTSNALVLGTVLTAVLLGATTYFGAIYALDVPGVSDLMDRLPGFRRGARPTS
jgi:putative peptidoglycan lipid II flippase